MSFYASQTTPQISAPQQAQQPSLNVNSWATNPLDQFEFQHQQPELSFNPMGGLRRPSPSPIIPQPSPQQTLSLTDTAAQQFPNFSNPPTENERLVLDTARIDFDPALQPNSTQNNFPTNKTSHRSQPTPPTPYQQVPDPHPAFSVSPNQGPTVPVDAFDFTEGLSAEPAPHAFLPRGKQRRNISEKHYIDHLISLDREQRRAIREQSQEAFWRPFISKYFIPAATLHINFSPGESQKLPKINIPVEALPRICKAKIDAGVKEEKTMMGDPVEYQLSTGEVVVECPDTLILTTYENCTLLTHGSLRVQFLRNRKITSWEFFKRKHEELYTRSALRPGSIMNSGYFQYGLPENVMWLMTIANDVNNMADKMSEEIAKIVSDPQKIAGAMSLSNFGEQINEMLSALDGQANGNAFRAIRSVLDPSGLDHGIAGNGKGANAMMMTGGSNGRNFSADLNLDAGTVRNAINCWTSEHQGTRHEVGGHEANMIYGPGIHENGRGIGRGNGRGDGDLNLTAKVVAGGIGDAQAKTIGQSAIEAANAAATGQADWGVDAIRMEVGEGDARGDGLGCSLELLNPGNEDNVNLRRDSGNVGGRSNVSRQSAPPGLIMFTPQAKETERKGATIRRSRSGRGNSRRTSAVSAAAAARQGNIGNLKEHNESFRAYQRVGGSKGKRGPVESAIDAGRSGVSGNYRRTISGKNGGFASGSKKRRSDGGKGKDHNLGSGVRRGSGHNGGQDERHEKRQKTNASIEQK